MKSIIVITLFVILSLNKLTAQNIVSVNHLLDGIWLWDSMGDERYLPNEYQHYRLYFENKIYDIQFKRKNKGD